MDVHTSCCHYNMNNITDADILDTVRKLRSYMSTLDNVHQIMSNMEYIGDATISGSVTALLPKVINTTKDISITLKLIENSKSYRDMLKNFNMDEVEE